MFLFCQKKPIKCNFHKKFLKNIPLLKVIIFLNPSFTFNIARVLPVASVFWKRSSPKRAIKRQICLFKYVHITILSFIIMHINVWFYIFIGNINVSSWLEYIFAINLQNCYPLKKNDIFVIFSIWKNLAHFIKNKL